MDVVLIWAKCEYKKSSVRNTSVTLQEYKQVRYEKSDMKRKPYENLMEQPMDFRMLQSLDFSFVSARNINMIDHFNSC